MKVFHCNYAAQTAELVKALSKVMPASREPKSFHSYVVIDDTGVFYTAVHVLRGTEFTHLTLDDTDALKLLNPEAVLPFLMEYTSTHSKD